MEVSDRLRDCEFYEQDYHASMVGRTTNAP